MQPVVALSLWTVLIIGLLVFDPAKDRKPSMALWVPMVWMFIVGSRLPSQWLEGEVGMAADTFEQGNSTDRAFYVILIFLAIGILMSRSFSWANFFTRNFSLVAFIGFGLLSVLWSDYSFISFKRWFRDLGNYLVVLVALTDPRPIEAVRTLLRRLGYVLISLSLLLVKYYPLIGVQFNEWTGTAMYVGPTTSKNNLGIICLISGLFFYWDTVSRWADRRNSRTKHIILVNVIFLAMVLHLLHIADSATSQLCFMIGCLVISAAHSKVCRRNPSALIVAVPACLFLYVIASSLGGDMTELLAQAMGRNPTLTGRTDIWKFLLNMGTDPLLGTGYSSFWLGPRLNIIWQSAIGVINEAHNGYLELYLNVGLIGLSLFVLFLIGTYRTVARRLRSFPVFGSLSLALWTVTLIYNVTEAAFSWQFMWVTFLIGALSLGSDKKTSAKLQQAEVEAVHQL